MERQQKYTITKGYRNNKLTVLEEAGADAYGHKLYRCQCDCGNITIVQRQYIASSTTARCKRCAEIEIGYTKRHDIVGKTINGWQILSETERNIKGVRQFLCRCVNCGYCINKSGSSIRTVKKGGTCKNCLPDYRFAYFDKYAKGYLANGNSFIVDADIVPLVKEHRWVINTAGYILCIENGKIRLHRFVLGIDSKDKIIVDHINRDKTDCRRENLRVVTNHQNNLNRSLQKSNISGFVGVCYIQSRNQYIARIGLNNRDIYLGAVKNYIEGAQAHNIAAEMLYGEFAGHINDVPPPTQELVQRIQMKCLPYLSEAQEVVRKRTDLFFVTHHSDGVKL